MIFDNAQRFKPHSPQQELVLKSQKPIVLLATGIQFGKTVIGALKTKIAVFNAKSQAPNFLITSPTYKILAQSTLPPFLRHMDGYGVYNRQEAVFKLANGGNVFFRTAENPDSIVGITDVEFIYGDEAGLYSLYFWENIQARAAFKNAQILLTTSPYTLNWVYREIIKPKQRDPSARPDVEYIKARSIDNPHFPKDYYERMRETMDERRFRAMFGGEWERMEGLVYDCFDEDENLCSPRALPQGTNFHAGVDWGTTNPFALVVRALTPAGDHYQLTEVYKTGLTIIDMIQLAKQKQQAYGIKTFFCDPSQPGYIEEFNRAGLPAVGANNDIRRGVDLHYELIKTRRLKLFRGDNKYTIDEYETYHYPSPADIKADRDIKEMVPVAQNNHSMDANRYVTMSIYDGFHRRKPEVISHLEDKEKKPVDLLERLEKIRQPKIADNFESW